MTPFDVIALLEDCSYPQKKDLSYVSGVIAVLSNLTADTED